jgi:dUTP pyrophosphatase
VVSLLFFAKIDVDSDAKIPNKRKEDAGYDFYACFKEQYIIVPAFTSKLIPTGIASAFPCEFVMLLEERGSTGVINLKRNAGVIDSGYRNEILACLYNGNSKPLVISKVPKPLAIPDSDYIVYPYEKALCQALILRAEHFEPVEVPYEELLKHESERMLGKLGSSNK